jgi:UDP-2,3-diacylglucosamine pyrophosphatase LpxH
MQSAVSVTPPVTVLSDLHLGHPASYLIEPEMVLPLFGDARTVVFNGDSAELVNLRRRPAGQRMLARLTELCHDRGVQPVFLTGNHDPHASTAHHLDLFDGKVFLTHGDILHPAIAPWSRDAGPLIRERRRLLLGQPEPEDLHELCLLAKRCSLVATLHEETNRKGLAARMDMVGRFLVQPWRIAITLNYWANVARYCSRLRTRHRPQARLMLIGHTHRAGVWPNRDFTLVNTGSFQPLSQALVARLDERRVIVRQAVLRANAYQMGRELYDMPLG